MNNNFTEAGDTLFQETNYFSVSGKENFHKENI